MVCNARILIIIGMHSSGGVEDHFVEVGKLVIISSGTQRDVIFIFDVTN